MEKFRENMRVENCMEKPFLVGQLVGDIKCLLDFVCDKDLFLQQDYIKAKQGIFTSALSDRTHFCSRHEPSYSNVTRMGLQTCLVHQQNIFSWSNFPWTQSSQTIGDLKSYPFVSMASK